MAMRVPAASRRLLRNSNLRCPGLILTRAREHVSRSSMFYTGTEVHNLANSGEGLGANGWEDGGMGGRSRWGNCSSSCPWAACSARCKLDGAARRYSLKT